MELIILNSVQIVCWILGAAYIVWATHMDEKNEREADEQAKAYMRQYMRHYMEDK